MFPSIFEIIKNFFSWVWKTFSWFFDKVMLPLWMMVIFPLIVYTGMHDYNWFFFYSNTCYFVIFSFRFIFEPIMEKQKEEEEEEEANKAAQLKAARASGSMHIKIQKNRSYGKVGTAGANKPIHLSVEALRKFVSSGGSYG